MSLKLRIFNSNDLLNSLSEFSLSFMFTKFSLSKDLIFKIFFSILEKISFKFLLSNFKPFF